MTDSKTPNKISRRGFLIAMTGSALAVAAACNPSSAQIPTPYVPGRGPLPTGTPQPKITPVAEGTALPDPKWGKVTFDQMIYTDVEQLYITQYDYNNTPEVDAAAWNLKVDGLVENPFNLTLDDIKALPVYEDVRALECISDPVGGNLIGNMTWKGIHFEEILKRANLKSTVNHVRFEAADGYSTSVTLDWMTQPNVMLAYEMNGKPLTTVHGFPLRLHIPGLYGQKMPRWLTHIEFIDHEFTG
jgi:DMSO/TMAO reductase YedYZ molybdopterin-dependent catalytic subunit